MTRVQPSSTFELKGPDGGKLLGFLAALGALAALTEAWPEREIRLSWTQRLVWRPVLGCLHPAAKSTSCVASTPNLGGTARLPSSLSWEMIFPSIPRPFGSSRRTRWRLRLPPIGAGPTSSRRGAASR